MTQKRLVRIIDEIIGGPYIISESTINHYLKCIPTVARKDFILMFKKSLRYAELENHIFKEFKILFLKDPINFITNYLKDRSFFKLLSFIKGYAIYRSNENYRIVDVYIETGNEPSIKILREYSILDNNRKMVFYTNTESRSIRSKFLNGYVSQYFNKIHKKYPLKVITLDDFSEIPQGKDHFEDHLNSLLTINYDRQKSRINEKVDFLVEIIKRSRFLVFEIEVVKDFISELELNSPLYANYEPLGKITNAISYTMSYKNRINTTQRYYWLIYCLVEKMKEYGFGVRQSFRKLSILFQTTPETIQARYYPRKTEVTKSKLNTNNIIDEYGLSYEISHYLSEEYLLKSKFLKPNYSNN